MQNILEQNRDQVINLAAEVTPEMQHEATAYEYFGFIVMMIQFSKVADELKSRLAYGKSKIHKIKFDERYGSMAGIDNDIEDLQKIGTAIHGMGMEDPRDHPQYSYLMHAALGVFSEIGEMAEAIFFPIFKGKGIDVKHVIEEDGDLRFFLEMFGIALNYSEEQSLEQRIEKLKIRQPTGKFVVADAIARADKPEGD